MTICRDALGIVASFLTPQETAPLALTCRDFRSIPSEAAEYALMQMGDYPKKQGFACDPLPSTPLRKRVAEVYQSLIKKIESRSPGLSGEDRKILKSLNTLRPEHLQRLQEIDRALSLKVFLREVSEYQSSNNGVPPTENERLHIAARVGCSEMIGPLVQAGADVNNRSPGWPRNSPLHAAVRENQIETIGKLIELGADVNALNSSGGAPLHCTANACAARILLDNRANVNGRRSTNDVTPLHEAAYRSHLEVADLLLDRGAELEASDGLGHTALHFAFSSDRPPSPSRETLNQLLLEKGADVDARDSTGETALHYAVKAENVEGVRRLLAKGARPSIKGFYKMTPLHHCIQRIRDPEKKRLILASLLDGGADVNAQDLIGHTALHCLVGTRDLENLRLLLRAGADVNIKNRLGKTALDVMETRFRGQSETPDEVEMRRLLIEAGAERHIISNFLERMQGSIRVARYRYFG